MTSFSNVNAVPETALIPWNYIPSDLPVTRDLAEVAVRARQRVQELVDKTISPATRKVYDRAWKHFTNWCTQLGVVSMPASVDTVLAYASELPTMVNSASHGRGTRKSVKVGYSVASIERTMGVIAIRHKEAGLDNPCGHPHVHRLLKGIRRELGTAPKQKAAMVTAHFRKLRRTDDESVQAIRDRAVLLVAFAGAFRRSEATGLNVTDLEFGERTLTCHLRRSKTDQEGAGRRVVIHAGGALCPIEALKRWLEVANITEGAVFRSVRKGKGAIGGRLSTEGLSLIVKRHAAAAGLNPADFAGHSLRSGHVTSAILRGESAHAIMAVTGHQSQAMVNRYFRDVEPLRHNSSANLGL